MVNNGNQNSKTWLQTCKSLLYNKPVIKAPLNNNGSLVTDNKQKADIFNRYFVKGVVNCQNSRDKGPPEGNSARG